MNCGWHSTCLPSYPDGVGVDWFSNQGTLPESRTTYWRSWNWITNISFLAYVADVKIERITTGNCYQIDMTVRDDGLDSKQKGKLRQLHADRSGTGYFWLHAASAANGGFYVGPIAVGTMVATEKQSCNWTGIHVHQEHANQQATWTRNVGAPPTAIRGADDCSPAPCKYTYEDPGLEPSVWERHLAYNVTW